MHVAGARALRLSSLVTCAAIRRASGMSSARVIRGVVFDMDGTCTLACINFTEMRRRAGILTGDILEELDKLPPDERQRASTAIEEVELEALDQMSLMPGLLELCEWLDEHRIPRGLITRNSQISVDHFHSERLTARAFEPALCRDFKPFKPSPAALQHICRLWNIDPSECMMVGDSAKDDVVSGNRAGAATVLLDTENAHNGCLEGELKPTVSVSSLSQLRELLKRDFRLLPPAEDASTQ